MTAHPFRGTISMTCHIKNMAGKMNKYTMIRSLSMIAFSLTNIKDFMSHLLLNETFDHFSFIEGEITTFNTFHIDGFIKKEVL